MVILVVSLTLGCASPREPDVLVITLDTVRADALGAYGNVPSPTPTLDALAKDGLLVAEASTVAPLTLPAHASLFTGLTPARHGIRDNNGYRLVPTLPTLAERFHTAGWQTGAFVAASVLDSSTGLDRGFATYRDGFDPTATALTMEVPQRDGAEARAYVQEWLLTVSPDRPFFGWVHFYDAHEPLTPPEEWQARVADPYLAEIAFVDHQVRILLQQIRVLDRRRPLVVAVVGDHGEDRGDHGEKTHGIFLYRSTMHIPMILSAPGVSARVERAPRSIVDVAPTLLELAGLSPLDTIDGRSLLGPAPDGTYAESWTPRLQFGFAELRSLQDERYRYIRAPRPELYDWQADPTERDDLASRHPDVVAAMESRMAAHLANARPPATAEGTLVQSLEALGYVAPLADVPESVPYTALRDPKDDPRMALDFHATIARARTVPPAEGIPLLEAYLRTHPRVGGVRPILARGYTLLRRFDEAQAALEPLLAAHPEDATLTLLLASLHLETGDVPAATELAETVRRRQPEVARAWALVAEAHRRADDCAAATQVADEGLALHPDASLLRLVRGACRLLVEGESAVPDLEAVLASDPHNPDVRYLLGAAYSREGRPEEALRLYDAHLARDPSHVGASVGKGMVLANMGRVDEAVPLLSLAFDHPEVGVEPLLLLAIVLQRDGTDPALARRARKAASVR